MQWCPHAFKPAEQQTHTERNPPGKNDREKLHTPSKKYITKHTTKGTRGTLKVGEDRGGHVKIKRDLVTIKKVSHLN